MWSYYGNKNRIAKHYPKPIYDTIIEPFSGSAWYSVLNRNKNIILNEKYDVIYNIWNWLINDCDSNTILNNSDFYEGEDIKTKSLRKEHLDLIGFCINRASVAPCSIVQKWSCQSKDKPNWASTTSFQLKRIAKLLPEIKHWKTNFGDYKDLPNIEATWFIDPPYQVGGEFYKESNINYEELAEWCKSRKGQVIVCENDNANWLPFEPLLEFAGVRRRTTEVMWTNKRVSNQIKLL